ncbi:TonB-dependent receptor [Altererythrobacter sp. ZODW24]|uniref:TonB-dependent receptor plug domain-containing protein n=1 Tax=Altererythrobacter sp. ZODW24 TaxID=2185142 RepID=UPI000DF7AFD8|nr:TonB-dependent receptor [Altererythrobacter sp. ZODW24]
MYKHLLFIGVSLGAASPALGQNAESQTVILEIPEGMTFAEFVGETTITVTADGLPQNVRKTAQSVSIIGAEELESIQGADITRVLRRAPGVTISRNGGVGGFTGVRIRGAEAEQLLVVVDGVRVADQASPGGSFDFGNLLPGTIGKIELLRGSNSTIWGSQAIGGVLAVTSRQPDGVFETTEYGSRDTFYAARAIGIKRERFRASLSGSYYKTDGFSSAANGTEKDGFKQWQIGSQLAYDLTDTLAVDVAGRFADGKLDTDGFANTFPFGLIDTDEFQETDEVSGRIGATYQNYDLTLRANYSATKIERDNFNPAFGDEPGFASVGQSQRAELRGRYDVSEMFSLDFGGEKEWSNYSTNFDSRQTASIGGAYAQLGVTTGGLTINGGARVDDHSDFGSEVSFGADASYALSNDWRLRGSFGEGFKAPTLFQLFSDFGNTTLQPERSRSYEVGIEKGDRNGAIHLALTAFRRNTRDQIDFVSCFGVTSDICTDRPFGTYDNVGRARAEGFEAELGARVSDRLRASSAYSYVKARNLTEGAFNEGNDLARRPRHALSASLDWTGPKDFALGVDLRMVGDSFDNASNFTRLDGYALADIRASVPVSKRFELFGRVENVTDTEYQTAAGYATAGRSVFVGARAKF